MGDPRNRGGPKGCGAGATRALCVASLLCVAIAASARKPAPPAPVSGAGAAAGSVIGFQESAGGRILYLEEKGGIVSAIPTPVPGSGRDELPALESTRKTQLPAGRATQSPPPASRPAAGKPAASVSAGTKS